MTLPVASGAAGICAGRGVGVRVGACVGCRVAVGSGAVVGVGIWSCALASGVLVAAPDGWVPPSETRAEQAEYQQRDQQHGGRQRDL